MLLLYSVYLETGELQINYDKSNNFAASISPSLGFSSFCFIASTFSMISVLEGVFQFKRNIFQVR